MKEVVEMPLPIPEIVEEHPPPPRKIPINFKGKDMLISNKRASVVTQSPELNMK